MVYFARPACQLMGGAILSNVHSQLILVAVEKPTHSGPDRLMPSLSKHVWYMRVKVKFQRLASPP